MKPIVNHGMLFIVSMNGNAMLAKEIANLKVYLKYTKEFEFKTLKNWYDEAKMDRVVMNKIMLTYRKNHLPSKSLDYKKYIKNMWVEVRVEFGFTKDVILDLWQEIHSPLVLAT